MAKKGHQADLEPDLPDVGSASPVKQHEVEDEFHYDTAFRLAFVGLGQAGGRMAATAHAIGYRRVAAINTATTDLADLPDEILKIDLATGGAGQDMEQGRRAFEQPGRREQIWDSLIRAVGDTPDYLLVCAGLGGGTGGGGAAWLIDTCRQYMADRGRDPNRVGAIVSLPNPYEGQRKCKNALQAFREVYAKRPAPFILVDNKRIEELFQPISATSLFPKCNEQVLKLLHLFNRLAAQRSQLMTFDRADFAQLLDSGLVVFGASPIPKYETKADLKECVREQLGKTVLAEVDLSQGTMAGCVFLGGPKVMDQVPMDYFGESFSMLTRMLAPDSTVFQGVYVGSTDDLRAYTVVGGLQPPAARLKDLAEKGGAAEAKNDLAAFLGVDH